MNTMTMRGAMLLALMAGLGACGNKGPLVQPDKADTQHAAKKAPAAKPDEPHR